MDHVRHTYFVVEESGMWHVVIDNEIHRNISYRTEDAAQRVVDRLTAANNLWYEVFEIETKIAEAFKDKPWPYGATLVNQGTTENPSWLLTEPYRDDDETSRIVTPDPTGYVQMSIYTRDLYETACATAGIEPDTDETIAKKFDAADDGQYVPDGVEPIDAVKIRLNYRRFVGVEIEMATKYNANLKTLREAGLVDGPYTREQYETACEIMGSPVLDDDQIWVVVTLHALQDIGLDVFSSELPSDTVSVNLAYRRSMGIHVEKRAAETTGDDNPQDEK